MFDIINPRQTILVSCRAEITDRFSNKQIIKDNLITVDWHTPISFNPQLYAISIGKERFSSKLIKESKCFVVNFMPYSLKKQVLFCGRNSGEFIDKFKETGLEKEEAEKIDCCRVKQALAFIECSVIKEIELGDHILFVGKVLKSKLKEYDKRLFHLEGDKFTTTI